MRDRSNKIRHLLIFTGATLMGLMGIYYLTATYFPKVSNDLIPRIPDKISAKIISPYWADRLRFNTLDPGKERIMLSKDDGKIVEDIMIIYRGSESRSQFKMDVIVMQFDPEMQFAHSIDVTQAKKGFRLAGKEFQLISARKYRLHLWYYRSLQR